MLGWQGVFEPVMATALPVVKEAQLTDLRSGGNKPPAETQGQAEVLSTNW